MKVSKQEMDGQPHDLDALAAFIEGGLDGADRQRVLAHVADCADCRRTLAELGRAAADGGKPLIAKERITPARWTKPRIWLPIAASVLVGSFAWFLLPTSPDEPTEDELLVTRSAGQIVAGKTFRLESGVWIDAAFDASRQDSTVTVSGLEERSELLGRIPELAPYTELGDRVIVVWEGTPYRFEP